MLHFGLHDGNPKFNKSLQIKKKGSGKKIFNIQVTKLDHLEKN